jgi:hypothetical protein
MITHFVIPYFENFEGIISRGYPDLFLDHSSAKLAFTAYADQNVACELFEIKQGTRQVAVLEHFNC